MAWWGRASLDGGRVGIRSARTRTGETTTRVSVNRGERYPGCDFPHLAGVVLKAPPTVGPIPAWTYHRRVTYTDADGTELLYRMPILLTKVHNLALGESRDYDVPAATEAIAGLLFGSLTTKAWIDDGQAVTWLNDHANQPGLTDFIGHVGTDPLVRIFDVDPRGPSIVVTERETLRRGELGDNDRA